MKIGIDAIFEDPRLPTGATGYLINLLNCLRQIDRTNEYFVFVSRQNRHLFEFAQENFKFVVCWASNENRPLRIAAQQLQIPWLVRQLGIEVLNSPANVAPLLLPCASVLNIKTMHHYHFEREIGWSRALFRRCMVYCSAQRATYIIANSLSNRSDIMQFLNIPAEKIVVIHEAVDKENFRRATNPQAVEAKLRSWNVRKPFLLSVSSLWRYKNQTGIARAFARLIQKYNIPHQLVFVGGSDQPDYEAEVRALVQELGVQERTRFLGYLPHSELAYCYQAADVFVYPSFFETFGLTLLEAMACGTPIVCSDRGSLPEIAGAAALTVNPEQPEEIAEAIARLLFDPTVRDSLVANGYRRLQEFSWQKTAEQTLTVLLRAGRESRERQTARNGSTAAT